MREKWGGSWRDRWELILRKDTPRGPHILLLYPIKLLPLNPCASGVVPCFTSRTAAACVFIWRFSYKSSDRHILLFVADKPAAHFSQREDERIPLLSQRLGSGHCQTRLWQLANGWVAPFRYVNECSWQWQMMNDGAIVPYWSQLNHSEVILTLLLLHSDIHVFVTLHY